MTIKRKPKNPITTIRTGTGDDGTTVFKGEKIPKNSDIINFLGDLDEACSAIGKINLYIDNNTVPLYNNVELSKTIIFDIGALTYTDSITFTNNINILSNYVTDITEFIKEFISENELRELGGFIIPNTENGDIMLSRAIVRRAERSAVSANCLWAIPALNTMSDFLFLLAWYFGGYDEWKGFNN